LWGIEPIRDHTRIRSILEDLVVDFPFKNDALATTSTNLRPPVSSSRENFFGLLLTPMLVPALRGNIPQHHVGASQERIGKGRLARETVGFVYLGRALPPTRWPIKEEEREKRIIAILRVGATFLLIDNIDAREALDSATLSMLLTARSYSGRLLGGNEQPTFPNNLTIISTGNNNRMSSEVVKRVVPVLLVSDTDHPETRTNYVYPDLESHVLRVRRDVLGALWGMVENWKDAGRLLHPRTLGGFEEWSATVGGILGVHGFENWRTNEKEWRRRTDPDSEDIRTLVDAWAGRWPEDKKTPKELTDLAIEIGVFPLIQRAKNLAGMVISFSASVLRRYVDQPVGDWIVRASGSGNASLYYLEENKK
jgi:hypothetical protein